jgi:hypothetical protein
MDLATTIVVILAAAAIIGWIVSARDGRALEAFGAGFIGYRSYGWPRGVQEEDEIHFSFDERADPTSIDDRPLGPNQQPELLELDRARVQRLERLKKV